MRGARFLSAVVLLAFFAACGGSDVPASDTSESTGPSATPGTATTAVSDESDATVGTGTEAETTSTTAASDPFDVVIAAAESATPGSPGDGVGTPDFEAADAVAADLGLGGLPPEQGSIWVLPVSGTDERLLVLEVYPAAEDIEANTEVDLFEAIVASEAVADAGVTRFVFHYFDADEAGDFVLTMTMPFEALARFVNEDADIQSEVLVEQRRIEWSS